MDKRGVSEVTTKCTTELQKICFGSFGKFYLSSSQLRLTVSDLHFKKRKEERKKDKHKLNFEFVFVKRS